jgi:hypothetical protein
MAPNHLAAERTHGVKRMEKINPIRNRRKYLVISGEASS